MLPRAHRLRHRKDFSRVYRQGLRRNSQHLTLRALNVGLNQDVALNQRDTSPSQTHRSERSKSTGLKSTQAARRLNPVLSDGDDSVTKLPKEKHSQAWHPLNRRFQLSPDESPTQVGISISTKVSKRATVRNRIKRQIKAAMFHLLPGIGSNWLIVISVRPQAIECDYWQILRELEEMIKNLR